MGGSPPPPDTQGLLQQQGAINQQMAQQQDVMNRPNQYSQWGSSTWSQDPNTGQWTQNQTLNPLQQQALDSQFRTQAGLQGIALGQLGNIQQDMQTNPWQQGGLTAWGQAPQYSNDAARDASAAVYGQATSRLDPQWNKAQEEQQNQLAAMGLHPGDQAYQSQMDAFNRQKADAYNQANFSAVGAGQNAYNQSFANSLQGANFADAQRQQQVGEAGTQANWNLGNLQRLISGMGVGQQQFGSTPGSTASMAASPDVMGAAQQQYNTQAQLAEAQSNMLGNIVGGGLKAASSFAPTSDVRAKDIHGDGGAELEDFLSSAEGSSYEYKPEFKDHEGGGHGEYVSPMAQNLEQSALGRDLVHTGPDGVKRVDYQRGIGTLMSAVSHVNKKLNRVLTAWGSRDEDENPDAVVAWGRRR